jgi:hypothetical protein
VDDSYQPPKQSKCIRIAGNVNWIFEYFKNRKKVILAAQRMEKFFATAPELRCLGDCYAAAIASESAMAAVPDAKRTVKMPQDLDLFIRLTSAENHTAEVLAKACELTRPICVKHKVAYTADYPELVRRIFAKNPELLRNVHGAYISDLMAAEYLLYRPLDHDGRRRSCDWLFAAVGFRPKPLFLNAMIASGLGFSVFSEHRADQIRDAVLIELVKKHPDWASMLCYRPFKRLHLLENMIANGFFPPVVEDSLGAGVIRRSMPLADAMVSLLKCEKEDVYETILLMGLIKRHSIGYVVKNADSERLKLALLKLYTAEELLPLVKEDRFIKGLLLEEAIGL